MRKTERMMFWLGLQIGKPYVWGSKGPKAFDCSGLVAAAYEQVGIRLPEGSFNQINVGRIISPDQACAGCLLFKRWPITRRVHHVAIVATNQTIVEARGKRWGVIRRGYNPKEWSDCRKVDALYQEL